eukprot:532949-Alexandrium_andersonii.AAC.1
MPCVSTQGWKHPLRRTPPRPGLRSGSTMVGAPAVRRPTNSSLSRMRSCGLSLASAPPSRRCLHVADSSEK